MRRTILIGGLTVAALSAQDSPSVMPKNPPALQAAIKELGKLKKLPSAPQRLVMKSAPASGACSVPLRAMPIDNPERFTVRRLPATEVEPMPNAIVPAPPCEPAPR